MKNLMTTLCHPDREHVAKGLCRMCYGRQWRAANPDRERNYGRTRKAPRKSYPDKMRAWRLQRDFGITVDEYDTMVVAQCGTCAICGTPESEPSNTGNDKRLSVDHNHETGEVRGLLCRRCNAALGQFRDSPDLIARALAYLGGR